MLDVRSYIAKRGNYYIKPKEDEWVSEIISAKMRKEAFFIVTEGFWFMNMRKQLETLLERYHIAGIFDLSSPYTNFYSRMNLIHVTAETTHNVKIAIYKDDPCSKRKMKPSKNTADDLDLEIPHEFDSLFEDYIDKIENWVNNSIVPEIYGKKSEFKTVEVEELDFNRLYPGYYTEKALETRRLCKKEKFMKLSEVADILATPNYKKTSLSYEENTENAKILGPRDFFYPLNIDKLRCGMPTKVILQKGDILFPILGKSRAYLFNTETEEPIYAGTSVHVIRCKNILPEYLYFYLNSDVAEQIRIMVTPGTSNDSHMSMPLVAMHDFPVPLPALDNEKYIRDFNLFSSLTTGRNVEYGQLKQFQLSKEPDKSVKHEQLADVIDIEIADKIKAYDEKRLRTFLTDDLAELNTCFKHKAYKATLILAGSILEAVLIDWLSEEKGKNYFEKNYYVTKVNKKGEEIRVKADLMGYIDEIKEIKRPNWAKEADEAHTIREKRNLVHAKLCMRSDENINEDTCKMVIDYLNDVLRTRGSTLIFE